MAGCRIWTFAAKNISDGPLPLSEALHTCLSVGDISKVTVSGLGGAQYIDKVAGGLVSTHKRELTFSSETNRIYFDTTADCIIHDSRWNRRIRVAKAGSRSTEVWNPWADRAAAMPDFGADEYPEMVCVETANCGPNVIELAPGQEHALQTQIEVVV